MKGLQIEKPNTKVFYERMLIALKYTDKLSVNQLIYKVNTLKKTYQEAVQWESKSGEGVEAGTVKGHLLSICDHYDLLDEIHGCTSNVIPPYTYESASLSSAGASVSYTHDRFDPDDFIVYDPEQAEIDEYDRQFQSDLTNMSSVSTIVATTNTNSQASTVTTASTVGTATTSSAMDAPLDTVGRFKRSLSTIPTTKATKTSTPSTPSTASAVMCEWQTKRADAINEKNKILKDKNEREERWKDEELRLAREKFKFDMEMAKEKMKNDMEMKKLEIEKEERLAIWKLELEYRVELKK